MSATDSDNSIDWLASDNEDNESERELDFSRTDAPRSTGSPSHLGPPDSSCCRGSEVKQGDWGSDSQASSPGSPSSCVAAWGRDVMGLCEAAENMNEKKPQQALKRPRCLTEECRERQLLASMSEKDRIFTRKCVELQCYIHPLSSILNGLRSGRYRERLSSFQESVAMDRIQRIMGVLRNPYMGEKYINIILKIEEMLKSWFPHVRLPDHSAVGRTEESLPAKKLKLSPMTSTAAVSPISDPTAGTKSLRVTDLTPPGAYSANHLKWLHTSPICSATADQSQAGPLHALSPKDSDPTQDSAVSSSTDTKKDSVPRGPPPPGKINAPCLEKLLKSTESIITRRGVSGLTDSSWS
ncbi:circadian-associated transcriptional repressor [Synchiropus splendidus]|uniref:circadian-associated transcriptional repressor n=1 Tax=Synchiropus splendidus TaxID=270530 RepID=UPI00237DBA98|nr:circadian-associated transcriptional repressor [Synchiropus splendidus]